MLYIGNTRYRVYSGRDRVSIESPKKLDVMLKNTLLPPGLLLYDYILSSGILWIDTEVICDNGISTYLDFQCTEGHSNYSKIMGYATSTSWTPYGFGTYTGTNGAFARWGNGTLTMSSTTFTTDRINATFLSNSTSNNGNIAIFDIAGSSGANYPRLYMKVFLCRITNSNNLLVRNLLPCTYLGEPGMWDTVENKFYGNEGSGEFTLGNKIILREYEYLENVSNSYINLEYIPTNTTGIKIEASPNKVQSALILLGRGDSSNNTRWWLNFTSGGNLSLGWNEAYSISNSYLANTWYVIKHNYLNSRTNSVNNIVANYLYPNLTLTSDPISLFTNTSNPSNYVFTGKVKYLYITEGDQIVRNFVPCTYNGIPGMWDKILLKFYGSSNNGTFVVGNEIKYYDYLQTANGAYIDTGFKPNQDTRVLADILLLNSNLTAVFGTRNNSGGPSYGSFVLWNSPAIYYQYGDVTYSTYKLSDAIVNEHITIDLNKNVGTVNNNSPVTCNTATFQTNYPFLIGNIHTASAIDPRPTSMKVYSFKIYDNDTLVRDYRPCLYNGVAGLWDSVERKFYGNANNTGVLVVGNDS